MTRTNKTSSKVSVPGANDWIKHTCLPLPNVLAIVVKAGETQPSLRQLKQRLFKLAAELEALSEGEDWIINVGHVSHSGRGELTMTVNIEAATDYPHEAERIETLLKRMSRQISCDVFLF